jgi:uncharacterized protein YabE (DUF348 family)
VLRTVKYGLHGAVLAGLVAAPLVWHSVDKTVQLVVDGRARAVHTSATDVGQVVRSQGYRVTSHDLLAPSASASIHDGSRIVLRRGRLLHLDVNGRDAEVWTTAPTVDAALAQLGYATSDFVSVSRSRRLPLRPTDIAIRTPGLVTVVHDGHRVEVTTTDATVGDLLADLDVSVSPSDRLSQPTSAALRDGETVVVQRVGKHLVTRMQNVPFATRHRRDSSMFVGNTAVVHPGQDGRIRVTYSVVYVDGKAVGRTKVRSVTVAKPQLRVVAVGTKRVVTEAAGGSSPGGSSPGGSSPGGSTHRTHNAPPAPSEPDPSPGSAKAIARQLLAARGWGSAQYDCLVTLWNHESGWRVHAANPSGAYGIPQALPGYKMSSAGSDWQDSAETQIKWGLGYIAERYGTPCGAWSSWQAQGGWY